MSSKPHVPAKPLSGTDQAALLNAMKAGGIPEATVFEQLLRQLDHHQMLARVFLLDGTPFVFKDSPMKYIIFREQVASEFGVGSQDVCIVGSARLGFSPSPHKFGRPFSESSDVDVVLVSEPLFLEGSQALFRELNALEPQLPHDRQKSKSHSQQVNVPEENWRKVKESVRNFVFDNFNPALLSYSHPLRTRIFNGISSTTGLFLALEPQVFVSKIRCRVFRTWRSAEDYYANTLRQAQIRLQGQPFDAALPDEQDSDDADPPNAG